MMVGFLILHFGRFCLDVLLYCFFSYHFSLFYRFFCFFWLLLGFVIFVHQPELSVCMWMVIDFMW